MRRRNLLAGLAASLAAGCTRIGETPWFEQLVDGAEGWHRALHRRLGVGRLPLAPEYARADISPFFRGNGSLTVAGEAYQAALAAGFADWRLTVGGLVARPLALSLAEIRALPQRSQITRHDCVEGWSAIGEWTGPQLSQVLAAAGGLLPQARYLVFRCADTLRGTPYYESCDVEDALHPQTIIAHQLNGEALPERNGAPLRLRLERQLGYKHAKYLTRVEAVASLDGIAGGKGGYWEDVAGYQWYAGI